MTKASQLFDFAKQTFTLKYILKTASLAALFLFVSFLVINFLNIYSVLVTNYSIFTKTKLLVIFTWGSIWAISKQDLWFLLLISVLFGANFALVLEKIKFLRKQSNLQLTIGSGIISIAATGCASCGLSIVSLVGLSSALAILPFGGIELYFLSIIILAASFIYNLNSIYKACHVR